MSAGTLLRRIVRRAAALPMSLLAPDDRAAVLEQLTEGAIAEADMGTRALRFYAPSPLLRKRAAGLLTKEPDTIAWLNGLGTDDVLWDIGANVGVFALYAAAARDVRVVAFEPSSANFFVLTRNVQLNGLSERITPYCLAVAERTELGTINLDSADLGAAMSQFGRAGAASRYSRASAPLTHGMAGVSIDDLVDRTRAIDWLRDHGLMLASTGSAQGSGAEQAANHLFVRR
jgi:FkbM family methyltransferase